MQNAVGLKKLNASGSKRKGVFSRRSKSHSALSEKRRLA